MFGHNKCKGCKRCNVKEHWERMLTDSEETMRWRKEAGYYKYQIEFYYEEKLKDLQKTINDLRSENEELKKKKPFIFR
jgi:CHAD domain-containing protein